MTWSWFDLAWPWIGLAAAAILLALLFGTNKLRDNNSTSRWHDPVWLSWAAATAYILHNFEEYGIDALGNSHAFPAAACSILNEPPYPACVIPPAFYLAVNIPAFWIAAILCAILSRRNPAIGLGITGLLLVNGLSHFSAFARGGGYNPGLATSILLFFPLFFWIVRSCFGRGHLSYRVLASLILGGALVSAILLGSMQARIHGLIGNTTLILIQIVNPIWFLLLPWLATIRPAESRLVV